MCWCFFCSRVTEKSKLFSNGKKKFNMDPKKVCSAPSQPLFQSNSCLTSELVHTQH